MLYDTGARVQKLIDLTAGDGAWNRRRRFACSRRVPGCPAAGSRGVGGAVNTVTGLLTLTGESTGDTTVTADACDAQICGEHDFTVTVEAVAQADLVVESVAVDDDTPDTGESFTLSATVRNWGDGGSAATTLRYYRSTDSTISTGDTEVGTDAVGTLGAGGSSRESIALTAPSNAGMYYYGACATALTGDGGGATDDHGDDIGSATSVSVPSTTDGKLKEGGDRDYFRLAVSRDTTRTVRTTGSTDTRGALFDGDGSSLETNDDDGAGTNFEIERDVDAGTTWRCVDTLRQRPEPMNWT